MVGSNRAMKGEAETQAWGVELEGRRWHLGAEQRVRREERGSGRAGAGRPLHGVGEFREGVMWGEKLASGL